MRMGDHHALTDAEGVGLNVFAEPRARCAECHTPPLFTNQQLAVLGLADAPGELIDPGAQAITGDASQRGAFRRGDACPGGQRLTCTAGKRTGQRTLCAFIQAAEAMRYRNWRIGDDSLAYLGTQADRYRNRLTSQVYGCADGRGLHARDSQGGAFGAAP